MPATLSVPFLRAVRWAKRLDSKSALNVSIYSENIKGLAGTDPSCWDLICSKFSGVFEKPGTPPEKAIKHEIDLLLDSVLPAKK